MLLRRDWDGREWEGFSRRLVQLRHGPQNVQDVPDRVKGDSGVEFFTTDGCCYQSYAPEETADTAKAASAMKQKATRDLAKLVKNSQIIAGLLGSIKIARWILVCPFLDDKSVIAHVRSKEEGLLLAGLQFLHRDFRIFVHCPVDYEKEIEILRRQSMGVPLKIRASTDDEVAPVGNAIRTRVEEKLIRAFPEAKPEVVSKKASVYLKSELTRSNTLHSLKVDYPDLWEMARRIIEIEEQRLEMIGAGVGAPKEQLRQSLDRLEQSLRAGMPSLGHTEISAIANGQLGAWLIECPLDFPDVAQ